MGKAEKLAQQVLDTSKGLLSCAERGDMAGFTEGQTRSNALISELNGVLGETEDADFIRATLNEAKAINIQVAASFKLEQKKLLDQKSELVRGHAMQNAYKAND